MDRAPPDTTDPRRTLEAMREPGTMAREPQMSVIVCTYNRADYLEWALPPLLRQSLDTSRYEVIVVDNNSTDGTRALVESMECEHAHLRYVFEPLQGVSNARNRGLREALGEFVACIDDDAVASNDWLENALGCFLEVLPRPQAVGGPCSPLYLSQKPAWFSDDMEAYDWGEQARFLLAGECFYGSNMFFDTAVARAVPGGFDPRFGPAGDRLLRGEEDIFFRRLWEILGPNAHFYYSPDVRVSHAVPAFRMTPGYRVKCAFAAGQSLAIDVRELPPFRRARRTLLLSYRVLAASIWAIWGTWRAQSLSGWIAGDIAKLAGRCGFLLGALGISPHVER